MNNTHHIITEKERTYLQSEKKFKNAHKYIYIFVKINKFCLTLPVCLGKYNQNADANIQY